jgi:hypothetical protein
MARIFPNTVFDRATASGIDSQIPSNPPEGFLFCHEKEWIRIGDFSDIRVYFLYLRTKNYWVLRL